VETSSALNLSKEYLPQKELLRDVPPLFQDSNHREAEESLESLAQQREKILGELFGRFKR
jgi:hypothetical protein